MTIDDKSRIWKREELANLGARHFVIDSIGNRKVKIENMMYEAKGKVYLWKEKDGLYYYHHSAVIIETYPMPN